MIQLKQIMLSRHHKTLLNRADLTIHKGQKVAIYGANGSGKTSLMMMLRGELHYDEGELTIPKQLNLCYLEQDIPQIDQPATDYVMTGDTRYTSLQQQLTSAESNNDGIQIADLHMKLAEIDGYTIPSKAAKILHGLGFKESELTKPLNSFSGGWQMRLNLAKLLMSRADVYLLDEPTNHLDLEAIVWLENWLRDCPQTILLISHDRAFIDTIATHIAHLYQQQFKLYTGNYTAFEKQRAQQLILQQASFEKQQKQRSHLQSYVDRFRYKASKARQAQSRLKMLERMETLLPAQMENPFQFSFKAIEPAGNPMLNLEKVNIGYDEKTIIRNINLSLCDGDRIGLIGPNGAGKSTLVKLLANKIKAQSGTIHGTNKIKLGYFAQHQLDLLNPESTPLQSLKMISTSITDSEARNYLGGFAFSNDDVFREISSFSGGEKARLVLALIIWKAPNLLLLDEPTNHLDMEMREALNLALQNYEGALIIVSHDRHLLNCATNELWLIADGKAQRFDGDLVDYQRWVLEREKAFTETKVTPPADKPQKSYQQRKEHNSKKLKLEKQLHLAETTLQALDDKLADPAIYNDPNQTELTALNQEHSQTKATIAALEEQLLELYADEE